MECPSCGSRDIEIHDSSGDAICVSCGTVLEENAIVSSVEFQESGDRSTVIGQFVASNCSKVRVMYVRLLCCYLAVVWCYFVQIGKLC